MDLILAFGFLLLFCIMAIAARWHRNLFMAGVAGLILIFGSLFIIQDGLTMQTGTDSSSESTVTQNSTHFITNTTLNQTYVYEPVEFGDFSAADIIGPIGLISGLGILVWITAQFTRSRRSMS